MAPLPENFAPTYFVDYQFNGQQHTLQARLSTDAALPAAPGRVKAFLDALLPLLDGTWAILGARFRAAGSSITVPTAPPVLAGAPSGGTVPNNQFPKFHSFVGRGVTTGRRVRVFIYGLNITTEGDYRLQGPLTGALGSALTALNAAAGDGVFRTIGTDSPIWNNYVNQGYNSYWERQQRG